MNELRIQKIADELLEGSFVKRGGWYWDMADVLEELECSEAGRHLLREAALTVAKKIVKESGE